MLPSSPPTPSTTQLGRAGGRQAGVAAQDGGRGHEQQDRDRDGSVVGVRPGPMVRGEIGRDGEE
jgi:hypothetical protein